MILQMENARLGSLLARIVLWQNSLISNSQAGLNILSQGMNASLRFIFDWGY